MAQTQYLQNRPTTLQDLLNQSASQPQAPVNVPAPPDASQVNAEGVMTPQDRQKLLDVLLAPDEAGPAPQVDKPSALAMLFSGLGDAVNAFNAGKTGDPGFRSNFFDQYQRNLANQKADLQRYQEKVAAGKNRSKQRTAEYLLSEADKKQMQADAIQGKRNLQTAMIADREQARLDRKAQADAELAARQQEFEAKKAWDTTMEKARYNHEESVARIKDSVAGGDKKAALDQKNLGEAIGTIGGMANIANIGLRGGDPNKKIPATTPQEIMDTLRRELDRLMLLPGTDARKSAEAYAAKELGPILKDFQDEQDAKAAAANPGAQAPPGQLGKVAESLKHFFSSGP